MNSFVLIIYPVLVNAQDFNKFSKLFNAMPLITSWTIDREDCDDVVRIEAEENIFNLLHTAFIDNNLNARIMATFAPLAE